MLAKNTTALATIHQIMIFLMSPNDFAKLYTHVWHMMITSDIYFINQTDTNQVYKYISLI